MTTPAEYGQLALYVYNVVTTPEGHINRPLLPSPTIWEQTQRVQVLPFAPIR